MTTPGKRIKNQSAIHENVSKTNGKSIGKCLKNPWKKQSKRMSENCINVNVKYHEN